MSWSGFPDRTMGQLKALMGRREGVVTAEFAVTTTLVISCMVAIMEVSVYMFTVQSVRTVAGEMGRQIVTTGSANVMAGRTPCTGITGDLPNVSTRAPFLDPSQVKGTVKSCVTANGVTTTVFEVKYPTPFVVPGVGQSKPNIVETSRVVFN